MDIETKEVEKVDENTDPNLTEDLQKECLRLLSTFGISNWLDLTFLDFSIAKSRELVEAKYEEPFRFILNLFIKQSVDKKRFFPFSNWVEPVTLPVFKIDPEIIETGGKVEDEKRYVVWSLRPSIEWETYEIKEFTKFHLYIIDYIKKIKNTTAEAIYEILEKQKGKTFFLTFQNDTEGDNEQLNGIRIMILISPKFIFVFHVPKVTEFLDEYIMSRWISLTEKVETRTVTEFDIFYNMESPIIDITDKKEVDTETK